MSRIFGKKRLLAGISVVAVLVCAAAAFAYFTSTGSGTSQATVGSATHWGVTFGTSTGTIYPGAGSTTIPYTITNNGSGQQNLAGTTAVVANDGSLNVTSHGVAVTGCLAADFTATNTSPSTTDLAAGATATGSVSVTMKDSGISQNNCQGTTPDITVSAS